MGLPENPGYEINRRQAHGTGGMLSFRVDSAETARRVLTGVKVITFAESLGGTESLVTYPLVQTHGSIQGLMLDKLGIDERLLLLFVGLENAEDLIADLEQAIG